jgi:hypothetical protein
MILSRTVNYAWSRQRLFRGKWVDTFVTDHPFVWLWVLLKIGTLGLGSNAMHDRNLLGRKNDAITNDLSHHSDL